MATIEVKLGMGDVAYRLKREQHSGRWVRVRGKVAGIHILDHGTEYDVISLEAYVPEAMVFPTTSSADAKIAEWAEADRRNKEIADA